MSRIADEHAAFACDGRRGIGAGIEADGDREAISGQFLLQFIEHGLQALGFVLHGKNDGIVW